MQKKKSNDFLSSGSVSAAIHESTTTHFFAHKKYSRGFITLRLNHWCHMDYFNSVLATFLALENVSCVAVYAGSESSRIFIKNILILSSEDERRSYGFGTTWRWVINDRMFIFGWTIPLIQGYQLITPWYFCCTGLMWYWIGTMFMYQGMDGYLFIYLFTYFLTYIHTVCT